MVPLCRWPPHWRILKKCPGWTSDQYSVYSKIGSGFFSISSEISVNLSKIPTPGPLRKKCQSKSRPMGQTDWSNPHPLPDPPPLGVNIDRCITRATSQARGLYHRTNQSRNQSPQSSVEASTEDCSLWFLDCEQQQTCTICWGMQR
jgi:hypothetical protein